MSALQACQNQHNFNAGTMTILRAFTIRRAYQERGVVDGWGLLHSILADAIDDVLGTANKEAVSAAAAEHEAWTLIASLAAEPARENCMGEAFP